MSQLDSFNHHEFRLPSAELNRISLKFAVSFLIALCIAHFAMSGGIGFFAAFVGFGIAIGGYFYTKQHVWITFTADGMIGRGQTNREVKINWSEPVDITVTHVSGIAGYEIRASVNDSFVKKKILSFFIPRAITETPEFAQALANLSPSAHPLRNLADLVKQKQK